MIIKELLELIDDLLMCVNIELKENGITIYKGKYKDIQNNLLYKKFKDYVVKNDTIVIRILN